MVRAQSFHCRGTVQAKKKKEKGNIEMLKNMNNYPNY